MRFRRALPFFLFAALFAVWGPAARADMGVVLADPTTIGASRFTHAGHSLVYLSGVCAETPVHARLCRPGEQGSIVTTYPDFREIGKFSWNMVPVSLYLQGSVQPGNRLLYTSQPVKNALQERARAGFLQPVCAENECPPLMHTYWRDLVAATSVRDLWIFAVRSSPSEDQAAVEWLNSSVNVNHYNTFTNNCADFTRKFLDAIFPHAVHRDILNDLGMTSPKAAARSFSRWALRQPARGFYAMHFAQQPGSFPRGSIARSGTEAGIHTKAYLLPAALIGDHEIAGSFFVAYFLTGRFGLYKTYARHPGPSLPDAGAPGTEEEWASYKERFTAMRATAGVQAFLPAGENGFPKSWSSVPVTVDGNGGAWLHFTGEHPELSVGIDSRTLLASGSEPGLAYQLMLCRVAYELREKGRMREPIEAFQEDWALLEQVESRLRLRDQLAESKGAGGSLGVH